MAYFENYLKENNAKGNLIFMNFTRVTSNFGILIKYNLIFIFQVAHAQV